MNVLFMVEIREYEYKYVRFRALQIIDENEENYFLCDDVDHDNYEKTFPKKEINKIHDNYFITNKLYKDKLIKVIDAFYKKTDSFYKNDIDLLNQAREENLKRYKESYENLKNLNINVYRKYDKKRGRP